LSPSAFFLALPPPPPISPPFPYTTLFRSAKLFGGHGKRGGLGKHCSHRGSTGCGHVGPRQHHLGWEHSSRQDCRAGEVHCGDHPDRKSTRLNSSHVSISYAVFCLKKKKNN